MRLYLVQHGKAVEKSVDPERPLTKEGVKEVESVGAFLSTKRLNVSEIWHSGKKRAEQTARVLARHITRDGIVEAHEGLGPKDEVRAFVRRLDVRRENLMVVGHLPFLSRLTSYLLVADERAELVAFHCAGVLCLERSDDGDWQLAWYTPPDLVKLQ